jgi:hypothetical protein
VPAPPQPKTRWVWHPPLYSTTEPSPDSPVGSQWYVAYAYNLHRPPSWIVIWIGVARNSRSQQVSRTRPQRLTRQQRLRAACWSARTDGGMVYMVCCGGAVAVLWQGTRLLRNLDSG